jgi:hypothetical protein
LKKDARYHSPQGEIRFFNIKNKGLFQESYGSRETGWTNFLFIEKRIASGVACKDAAIAARKYRKVDFV